MAQAVDLFQWRASILSKHGPRNPLARLVLITVSMPMKADGTGAWESQTTIATRACVGLRTVKRHLEMADRDGWVQRVRVKVSGKQWRRTEYSACVPDAVYAQVEERPWESDPMFRRGAHVAPSYTGKRRKSPGKVPTVQNVVPTTTEQGADHDMSMGPQLGPLTLHLNSVENSPYQGALARTTLGIAKAKEVTKETEHQKAQRIEAARRKALEDIASLQARATRKV